MSRNDHYHYVVSKATKCLNRLHHAMYGCTQEPKISNAYKSFVQPYLEYAWTVWVSYTAHDTGLLESVQNRAACWIKSYWNPSAFWWSKSLAICVGELGWASLKVQCNYFCIGTLYCISHKTTAIDISISIHWL